jgi:hypothetical protein
MTARTFCAWAAVSFVILYYLCSLAVSAGAYCTEMRWYGAHGFTGWDGHVKCYKGTVVGAR